VTERVWFESSTGSRLAGRIDLPTGEVRGFGVFVHGFTLGKDCPAAVRISRRLAAQGIGMLRFDSVGLGDSEGVWGRGGFTGKVADVLRAVAFMADRGTPADLLVGHSWGGAAVISATNALPDVRAVATINAPSDPSHVEHHYRQVAEAAMATGQAPWRVGGHTRIITRTFVEDVRRARILDEAATMRRPLLVVHSPSDSTVDLVHAERIFNAARHPRSFFSLEGSNHLLTTPLKADRAGQIIAAWADSYLSAPITAPQGVSA
jgi:putative redox protein